MMSILLTEITDLGQSHQILQFNLKAALINIFLYRESNGQA